MNIHRYKYGEVLEKRIKKYAKQFGITRAICTDSFFYIPQDKTVCFTLFRYTTSDEFINFINTKYDVDITEWYFVFSLLHEIGHHMTVNLLTDEEIEFETIARKTIAATFSDDDETRHALYFELPAEDLANKWAINYLQNHIHECWEFQNKCTAIMRHIVNKKCYR